MSCMKVFIVIITIQIASIFGANVPAIEGRRNGLADLIHARGGLWPIVNERIVGGQETTIERHPHQITMQFFGSHRCGGSIISVTRILTAAHCVVGISTTSLNIRAGSTNSQSGGQLIAVNRLIRHGNYNPNTLNNDIAVMILRSALNISPAGVSVIRLPNQGEGVSVGAMGTVTGWGATRENGPAVARLRAVDVPVVSNAQCNSLYGGGITANMLCAGFLSGGRDSCQGDSGGPYVIGGTLVGVVSFGYGCARPNAPGVYARVSQYRNWINNAV